MKPVPLMKHQPLMLILCACILSACSTVDRGNFGPFERYWAKRGHSYEVRDDLRENAPFKQVEIFEVRAGDCSSDGWNQCGAGMESSVLREKNGDQRTGDEYWYGWSIFFPENFPNVDPVFTQFGSFRQYSHRLVTSIWIFTNASGGYHLVEGISPNQENYELIGEKELRGQWHQIEAHVRWARDETGFFRVWVNGVQKVDYRGETIENRKNVRHVEFFYGISRYRVSRYKKRFNEEIPAQTVYFANVKRGDSRSALLSQNFVAPQSPPKALHKSQR